MHKCPSPEGREAPTDPRWRAWPTWLIATGAVVLLHQVAYLIAHPDPFARAVAAEGHAYLQPLVTAGVVVGAAVAVWLLTCRATSVLGWRVPPARELAGVIGVLFLGQEFVERLAQGGTWGQVVAEPAVWVGLVLVPLLAVATRGVLLAGTRLRFPAGWTAVTGPPPAPGWAVLLEAPAPLPVGVTDRPRARGPPPSPD